MIKILCFFIFLIHVVTLPVFGFASQPQPIVLNQWTDISTPDKLLDKSTAPAILKQYVGSHKYVTAYRIKLKPGEKYTFQTEYPADNKYAKATIYGLNPYSEGSSFSSPSGTSWLAISRARSFPGGNIKGYRFGRLGNFTVSKKSEHSFAFIIMAGDDPNVTMRCKIIHPAIPDEQIAKAGGYRIKPDGSKTVSWGTSNKTPLWLGYAKGVPKLPFPWENAPDQTRINVSGEWETQSGDLSLVQHGQTLEGHYPTDNGEITGVLKGNVFSGYWIEDKANQRCRTPLKGRHYWGKMRLVFKGDRFLGSWDYCGESATTSGWDGKRKGASAAAAAPASTSAPKAAAQVDDESWRKLPDFEFKLIED